MAMSLCPPPTIISARNLARTFAQAKSLDLRDQDWSKFHLIASWLSSLCWSLRAWRATCSPSLPRFLALSTPPRYCMMPFLPSNLLVSLFPLESTVWSNPLCHIIASVSSWDLVFFCVCCYLSFCSQPVKSLSSPMKPLCSRNVSLDASHVLLPLMNASLLVCSEIHAASYHPRSPERPHQWWPHRWIPRQIWKLCSSWVWISNNFLLVHWYLGHILLFGWTILNVLATLIIRFDRYWTSELILENAFFSCRAKI